MGTIQIKNVSFKYHQMTTDIFKDLNLQIDSSWKLGLIGRNGRGKTTLMKLLLGQLTYQGQIISDLNFNYYPQTVSDRSQTTLEVIQSLTDLEDYDFWKIEMEMEQLQLSEEVLQQAFGTLSPGEQTKVLLATLFVDEAGFQLLDEPTNHLDIAGRKVVADYLQNKKGFIVISHDKTFLNQIIDHVISINRNDVTVYKGNFDTWETANENQLQLEVSQKQQLKNDIQRLHKTAVKRANWAKQSESQNPDSTGRKMMKKAKTLARRVDQAIDEKQQLLKNIEVEAPLVLNYEDLKYPEILLHVDNMTLENGTFVTPTLDFSLNRHQIVALEGQNGIGKTTIFKQLLGIKQPFAQTGTINLAKGLKISYLAQNNTLKGSIKQLAVDKKIELELIYSNLRKLGFERQLFEYPVEEMSQGQRQKVALALSLSQQANLYLWDEPLNYLDVITRQQIIAVLKTQKPSMLLIDHDQDLINQVATQKIKLH